MEIPGPARKFDRYRQRHPALVFPIAMLKKFEPCGGDGLRRLPHA